MQQHHGQMRQSEVKFALGFVHPLVAHSLPRSIDNDEISWGGDERQRRRDQRGGDESGGVTSSGRRAPASLTVVTGRRGRRGRRHGWSAAVQAAVGPVTVALVVWVGEGSTHEAGHETSTSHTTVTPEHPLVARRQTTKFPAT